MTAVGFLVLIIVGAVVGAISEAIVGYHTSYGWLGTIVVGLVGAWIGSRLSGIGPVIGGIPLISAIIGAIILTAILKMITVRGHAA